MHKRKFGRENTNQILLKVIIISLSL